jgi:hypothetical protein
MVILIRAAKLCNETGWVYWSAMEVPPGLRGIERGRQLAGGSIATIFLEIGLSVLGPEKPPRELEGAARLVEGPGGASRLLRWMAAGIETAAPLPTCRTGRIADALSDHADLEHLRSKSATSPAVCRDRGGG